MKQVSNRKKNTKKKVAVTNKSRKKPLFGTSKLETDFAENFLDKLGVKYTWQFEAKDIGRFYDFYLPRQNLIIEVDGGFWHSDPRVVDENKLTPTQKKNKRVDEQKNKWALLHGIKIIRIWEKDIKENPDEVMKLLKKILYIEEKKENKKKRHKNTLK